MSITDDTKLKKEHLYDFTYGEMKYELAEYIKTLEQRSEIYLVFRILGHGPLLKFLYKNISGLQLHTAKISSLQALALEIVKQNLKDKMYPDDEIQDIKEYLEFIESEGKKGGKRKSVNKRNKRQNKKRTIRKHVK